MEAVEAVELGVTSAFGAVLWGLIFWLVATAAELIVTLRCRRVLANAGRPTGMPTFVMVLLLVVTVPFLAGYAGCAWSGQRSAAEVLDRVELDEAVTWAIHQGAEEVREELELPAEAAEVFVEVERLRDLARARADETDDELDELIEHAWWRAVTHVLDQHLPPKLTWDSVLARIEAELTAKVREQLGSRADDLRGGALKTLLFLLGFLVVVNAIAIYATRRVAAGGVPPQTPAVPA